MSEHKIKLNWKSSGEEFSYQKINRNHEITFSNGAKVVASAATDYLGDPSKIDPEGLFVAALSSCHMLTFLVMCAKRKLEVLSYEDNAVGKLGKDDTGGISLTEVKLNPKVEFASGEVSPEKLEKIHHSAHKYCFLANSVKTKILF